MKELPGYPDMANFSLSLGFPEALQFLPKMCNQPLATLSLLSVLYLGRLVRQEREGTKGKWGRRERDGESGEEAREGERAGVRV